MLILLASVPDVSLQVLSTFKFLSSSPFSTKLSARCLSAFVLRLFMALSFLSSLLLSYVMFLASLSFSRALAWFCPSSALFIIMHASTAAGFLLLPDCPWILLEQANSHCRHMAQQLWQHHGLALPQTGAADSGGGEEEGRRGRRKRKPKEAEGSRREPKEGSRRKGA